MRDVGGRPVSGASRRTDAVPIGRLPSGRIRLVTALFTDLDAAVRAAVAAEDRGYDRDRITVLLSPANRRGPDLEIRRRRDGEPPRPERPARSRPAVRTERLDDLLDGAHLIVAAEAATDAEGHELAELLAASGGRVVGGRAGSGARSPPAPSGPAGPRGGGSPSDSP